MSLNRWSTAEMKGCRRATARSLDVGGRRRCVNSGGLRENREYAFFSLGFKGFEEAAKRQKTNTSFFFSARNAGFQLSTK